MLPSALAVGVPYEIFWHLTPKKLDAFYKAHKIRLREQDSQLYIMGMYALSAISVAIEHNLHGKKAKSEYMKEPLLSKIFENDGLTEEEIQEKEIKKAILTEEQYMAIAFNKGLPQTKIK